MQRIRNFPWKCSVKTQIFYIHPPKIFNKASRVNFFTLLTLNLLQTFRKSKSLRYSKKDIQTVDRRIDYRQWWLISRSKFISKTKLGNPWSKIINIFVLSIRLLCQIWAKTKLNSWLYCIFEFWWFCPETRQVHHGPRVAKLIAAIKK